MAIPAFYTANEGRETTHFQRDPDTSPSLPPFFPKGLPASGQLLPVGTGRASNLRTMLPNNRRVNMW
jgi:hypothetical protein